MNHLNIVDMDNAIEELRKERDEAIVKCERLSELNNKLTEDFNTLALDRSQWQECAKKAEAVIKAAQPAVTDDEPLSARDLAMIDQAWENHKAALPVATVINDNQPGRTAIIEITIDPPTLPVGTKLYAGPKMVELAAETSPGDVVAMKEASIAARDLLRRLLKEKKLGIQYAAANQICWQLSAAVDRLDVKAEAKSQEPDAVAIKPLEWSDHEGDGVQVADAVTGEYRVRCHGGEFWVVARDGIPLSNRPYELASFAKAAAQADYEQRIRSALIHPTTEAPAVGVDAIKAIIRSVYGVGDAPYAGGFQDKSIDKAADAIAALIAGE